MSVFDIFNNDAFTVSSMLDVVDRMEFQPNFLGQMSIFTPNPIRTENFQIESRNGSLNIVSTSVRGAPLEQRVNEKRQLRQFSTTRIGIGDRITASELAFVRQHGEEQQVMMLTEELARRMNGPTGLMSTMEMTREHMRMGAINGVVLDADGSTVIYDWFQEFGITPAAPINFDLATNVDGALRTVINQTIRSMARDSGNIFTMSTRVVALCGDDFFDALVANPEVRDTYFNNDMSKYVPGGSAFSSIDYGGITWVNYRGTDDLTTIGVPTAECRLFPINTPGAFLDVSSPGEKFEHLGQLGRPVYMDIVRDLQRDTYVDLEAVAYPMYVCTRPEMLRSGTMA